MFPVRPENQWLKDAIDRGNEYLQKDLEKFEQDRYSVWTSTKTSIETKVYHVTGYMEAIKRGDIELFRLMKQDERYRIDSNRSLAEAIVEEQPEIIDLILCNPRFTIEFDSAFEYAVHKVFIMLKREENFSIGLAIEKFYRMLDLPFGNPVQNYAFIVHESMKRNKEGIALSMMSQTPLPQFLLEQKLISSWSVSLPKIIGLNEQQLLECACVTNSLTIVRYLVEEKGVDPATNNNKALKKTLEYSIPEWPSHAIECPCAETLEYLLGITKVFNLFFSDDNLIETIRNSLTSYALRDILAKFFPRRFEECIMSMSVFTLSSYGLFDTWNALFDQDTEEFTKRILRSDHFNSFPGQTKDFLLELYNARRFFTFVLDEETARKIVLNVEYSRVAVLLIRDGLIKPFEQHAEMIETLRHIKIPMVEWVNLFKSDSNPSQILFFKLCAQLHSLRPCNNYAYNRVYLLDEMIAAATSVHPKHNFVWYLFVECQRETADFSLDDLNRYLQAVLIVTFDVCTSYSLLCTAI